MRALLLCLLLSTSAAAAPLSLSNPPPGITMEAWTGYYARADKMAAAVAKAHPGVSTRCITAIALVILAQRAIDISGDARKDPENGPEEVKKGKEKALRESVARNRDNECNDGDGGSMVATLEAFMRWSETEREWGIDNPDYFRVELGRQCALVRARILFSEPKVKTGALDSLMKAFGLGVLLEVPASRLMPRAGAVIIDPCVVVRDAPFCRGKEGT